MRTRSWIAGHVRALAAAGGAPDIIVPDNCATATDRGKRGAPVKVNDAYLGMAEHYGCAVVPARVRRPRDMALAEKAVDHCETWVLAPLAGERFGTLSELNAAASELVDALNARPHSNREGSRDDAFLGGERAALNPLPPAHLEARSLWTREWFERRADAVGPEAGRLVRSVLDSHPVEPQAFVPCSNILSLSKRGRAAELEAACARINSLGGTATCTRVNKKLSALRAEGEAAPAGRAAPAPPPADRAAGAGRVRGPSTGGARWEVPAMLVEEDFALFTKWRVGAFGRKLREIVEDEALDDLTFEEKVRLCIDAELEARCNRKIEKAVRDARFKIKAACVEDVIYLPDRSITRDRVARLAACAWVEARENPVIISESGGGKSYLAQALGVAACRRLFTVRYARLNDMFRELNVARSEQRPCDAIDRFAKPDLLVLDDFFTTVVEDGRNAVDLFEILEAREGRGSTLIASQLEPDQWYLRIGSDLCADSILNRIVERARFLDIKGPNMRERMAGLKAAEDKGYWD